MSSRSERARGISKKEGESAARQGDHWERFWFAPVAPKSLTPARVGLSIAVVLYCFSWLGEFAAWYASDGIFPVNRLGRLVLATGVESIANWQISVLYWLQSPFLLGLFLTTLSVAAIAMGFGIGGRWSVALVWLGCISLANRSWLLVGPGEFALVTALGCLWIGGISTDKTAERQDGWSGLARRLLQVHLAAMVFFICGVQIFRGLTSMSAGVPYGAITRMIALNPLLGPEYAPWFTQSGLGGIIGGLLLVLPILALVWLVLNPGTPRLPLATCVFCGLFAGFLSGYWVLVVTWIAMLMAFLPTRATIALTMGDSQTKARPA